MLAMGEEKFCYQCHGSDVNRSRMISEGRLSQAAVPVDIEAEMRKRIHHPVEEGSGHVAGERLPSPSGGAITHAECVDCHNPHQRIGPEKKMTLKVSGYSISGQYLESSLYEYEICLKCHVTKAGFPRSVRDLRTEFSAQGRSQHPVTRNGLGHDNPSLTFVLGTSRRMTCSDCHRSGDSEGPRGPHGSNHQALLSGNYTLEPEASESPFAYEFCYSCHDRLSILSDESFSFHRSHITGDPLIGRPGTSCFTCHGSHGSSQNEHLIEFNPKAVRGEDRTNLILYRKTGEGSGECTLSCHGHNHDATEY